MTNVSGVVAKVFLAQAGLCALVLMVMSLVDWYIWQSQALGIGFEYRTFVVYSAMYLVPPAVLLLVAGLIMYAISRHALANPGARPLLPDRRITTPAPVGQFQAIA
jgi:hypothetical protein